ncbi:MAG: Clp protease N-terminal domain-containing protein, partial [Myxococcota bacterium]
MALPVAVELSQVFDEARDIAERVEQQCTTAHVLLAMFTLPNHAQVLLGDRRINEDRILAVIRRGDREAPAAFRELREKTEQLALSCGSRDVNCLHLLLAITRLRESLAHELLLRSGQDMTNLRTQALSYLTGRMPRRYANFRETSSLAQPERPERGAAAAVDRNVSSIITAEEESEPPPPRTPPPRPPVRAEAPRQ